MGISPRESLNVRGARDRADAREAMEGWQEVNPERDATRTLGCEHG